MQILASNNNKKHYPSRLQYIHNIENWIKHMCIIKN